MIKLLTWSIEELLSLFWIELLEKELQEGGFADASGTAYKDVKSLLPRHFGLHLGKHLSNVGP